MHVKPLCKPHTLTALESLVHRTSDSRCAAQLHELNKRYQLEHEFMACLNQTDHTHFECIWQYQTHHNIYINLIIITDNAVHLFKFNDYSGLHYIDSDGMLVNSTTYTTHADLSELHCMKYSVINVMPEASTQLPVYTKCVMFSEDFILDIHSHSGDILLKDQIIPYLERISICSKKKKKNSAISTVLVDTSEIHEIILPDYKRGISCPDCQSLNTLKRFKSLNYCSHCNTIVDSERLFNYNISHFKAIVSESKLTRRNFAEFTAHYFPPFILTKLLNKHFQKLGTTKGAYYV